MSIPARSNMPPLVPKSFCMSMTINAVRSASIRSGSGVASMDNFIGVSSSLCRSGWVERLRGRDLLARLVHIMDVERAVGVEEEGAGRHAASAMNVLGRQFRKSAGAQD